ncbi:MAG: transcriptional regulator, family, partial [Thermomicrobiales bacterium]|nr:transcriptional regulator, family [Thermomicrobiales bacterium]
MRTGEDAGKQTALLAFGHHLKRLRLAGDLTQEELAERAGVSARLISELERGTIHRPRRDTVQLLADGLRLRGSERDTFIALARGRPVAPQNALAAPPPLALPRPPTPIVGRQQELAMALAQLLDPQVDLLTLTGPGGVGKTRLSLELGSRAVEAMSDGAAFVDLAPVRSPELVLAAIARELKVQAEPEVPLRQTVVDFLQGKRLLLVLDNFEHVLVAAPVVADLLAACRELTILATSRKPLHIRAEHQFPVGPLTLPDLDKVLRPAELVEVPAVELFVRRAQAANREFSLSTENARTIAEITVRLDGLPLAIELAATRANVLSPAALLAHLERRLPLLTRGFQDLPERQQALRATLDWSHDLLTTAEQTLFRRLAVFTGGCTLDGAAAVSGASSQTDSPHPEFRSPNGPLLPDLLAGLVDTSLLRPLPGDGGELRYGMLETVREYGLEHLAAAHEEATVRRWHLAWCLDLAKRAEPELTGGDQQHWVACLQTEHDNLRAALAWAVSENDAEAALDLGGALYRFWATQGYYEEGRRWLETALDLAPGARSSSRGHALLGAGVMAFFQGDYDRAETLWQESLTL